MLMVAPEFPEASVMLVNALVPPAGVIVVVEVSLGLSHILRSLPKFVGAQAGALPKALALLPAVKLPVTVDIKGIY